jgi:hypothetical protein
MTSRRYDDEEVREIFSLATTGGIRDRSLPSESGGLTLDDLKRIGQEVGIEPAQVALAAERLDTRGRPPTAHGEQLRLSTLKDDGIALNMFSAAAGGMSVLATAIVAADGKPAKALVVLAMFGGMALVSFGANLLRLPRWARERERQMEAIAEHTVKLLSDS